MHNGTNDGFVVTALGTETCQGRQPFTSWESVDLSKLARSVVHEFSASTATHPSHFCADEDSDCIVMGDAEALRQLLVCLLSNAVISSEAGRDVSLSVWCRPNGVLLEVEDDGYGVPISSTERMFLPFTPVDDNNFTGNGDCLASITSIVRTHGAQIIVQGTPGCGTTFQVWFPA